MSDQRDLTEPVPFDEDTWQQMPDFIGNLTEPVCLHVWGDPAITAEEREATRLAALLSEHFPQQISHRALPRRINYSYYPVIGVMAGTAEESTDPGVRIIGLPIGFQMTSLVAAIQAVSFRGQTLEPLSRLKLHRMMTAAREDVAIEILTSAEDEAGAIAAKAAFGAAASTERIRTFLIVTDFFPEAAQRYSATFLPHIVINKRTHFNGPLDEEELVRQIGLAVKNDLNATQTT